MILVDLVSLFLWLDIFGVVTDSFEVSCLRHPRCIFRGIQPSVWGGTSRVPLVLVSSLIG